MKLHKTISVMACITLGLVTAMAQDKSTGGVKGKVRVETGSPSGVLVVVRQGDREVARTTSDRNGEFDIHKRSITFLRGSIFDENGRSLPNARVELARILDDGSVKKLDSRVTNETGSFVFRLSADTAKYRVTAKADGRQPASHDVDVDSAAVYRIAISLLPTK